MASPIPARVTRLHRRRPPHFPPRVWEALSWSARQRVVDRLNTRPRDHVSDTTAAAAHTKATRAKAHLDDIEHLALTGAGWAELEHATGVKRTSIARALRRYGRTELIPHINANT